MDCTLKIQIVGGQMCYVLAPKKGKLSYLKSSHLPVGESSTDENDLLVFLSLLARVGSERVGCVKE